ncbi:MAG: hypothetical protein KO316_10470 [Methanobacterium sp.]|nr:hypothetical protein [Methanobacterium sp.]
MVINNLLSPDSLLVQETPDSLLVQETPDSLLVQEILKAQQKRISKLNLGSEVKTA